MYGRRDASGQNWPRSLLARSASHTGLRQEPSAVADGCTGAGWASTDASPDVWSKSGSPLIGWREWEAVSCMAEEL